MERYKLALIAVAASMAAAALSSFPAFADARADLDEAEKAFRAADYETALKLVQPLADAGNAEAQRNLAVMYRGGRGVPKDIAKAIALYTKSAEQGFADAQYQLGAIYANGDGVAQDLDQARVWLRKAADGGMLDAERILALETINSGDADGGIAKLADVAEKGFVIAMLDLAQNLKVRAGKAPASGDAALSDLENAYKWVHVALPAVPSGAGRDEVHRLRIEIEALYKERDSSGAELAFAQAKIAAEEKIKELRAASPPSAENAAPAAKP